MKYALLIYSKPGSHEELPNEESEQVFAEYMALSSDPRCESGAQLQPAETSTPVKADSTIGRMTTSVVSPRKCPRPSRYWQQRRNATNQIREAATR